MRKYRSLPLGIDVGASRVRIAQLERARGGEVRLCAVVSRDLAEEAGDEAALAALVGDMLKELGTRERRCVFSVGAGDAYVRAVAMPPMSRIERHRAASFELQSTPGLRDGGERLVVRVHPFDRGGRYLLGAARESAIARRVALARAARLRIVAVDFDGCALHRSFPEASLVLDIGTRRATLHAFFDDGPRSWHVPSGGSDVTDAIASDLGVSEEIAEKRKRILGTAGAGRASVGAFASRLVSVVEGVRARGAASVLSLTGNGARLAELTRTLEGATGLAAEVRVPEILRGEAYPDDVVRAAAPDWALAAGLALHGCA